MGKRKSNSAGAVPYVVENITEFEEFASCFMCSHLSHNGIRNNEWVHSAIGWKEGHILDIRWMENSNEMQVWEYRPDIGCTIDYFNGVQEMQVGDTDGGFYLKVKPDSESKSVSIKVYQFPYRNIS